MVFWASTLPFRSLRSSLWKTYSLTTSHEKRGTVYQYDLSGCLMNRFRHLYSTLIVHRHEDRRYLWSAQSEQLAEPYCLFYCKDKGHIIPFWRRLSNTTLLLLFPAHSPSNHYEHEPTWKFFVYPAASPIGVHCIQQSWALKLAAVQNSDVFVPHI